jgi:uncharacterized membrane protein YphA (DoxX/SURF4 family)
MVQSGGRAVGVVAGVLGALMIAGGVTKLAGVPHHVAASFALWGLPRWFRLLVGSFEALGGVLLLFPGARPIGCLILSTITVGALWTHAANGEWLQLMPAGLCLSLFLFIFKRNAAQAIRLLGAL